MSGEEIRTELVGKTLEESGGGWTWVINADGTSVSEGNQSVWYLAGDLYCRAGPGDARYGCGKFYELAGIYRFTDDTDFAALSGWSVTAGAPVGGTGMPPPNQDAAARARMDVGELLSSGETLTARHVAGLELTVIEGSGRNVAPHDWQHFHLRRKADGELASGIQNRAYAYTATQRSSDFPSSAYLGPASFLNSWTGNIAELGSSNGDFYEVFHTGFFGTPETPELRGFAVIGNESRSLPSTGTATYTGNASIDMYDAEGHTSYNSETRSRWRSPLTLTADFGNSTISGRMDAWEVRPGNEDDYSPREGMLATIPETRFSADGFNGRLTVTGPGAVDIAAFYAGSFYGPDANNVVGTISATGRIDGETFAGIGWFGTDRDE